MLSMGLETGYAMKMHVERNLQHFWNESYGQIYPILRRLEAEGLVACAREHESGGRRRNRYRLTESGWTELRTWLAMPPEPQPPRLELLLKLNFGERIPPEVCIRHVREHRQRCQSNLEYLESTEKILSENPAIHRDQAYWLMTLGYGKAVCQAEFQWCNATLEQLEEIRASQSMPAEAGVGAD
jgi:DNA-binding PadR family transcriptional regulator